MCRGWERDVATFTLAVVLREWLPPARITGPRGARQLPAPTRLAGKIDDRPITRVGTPTAAQPRNHGTQHQGAEPSRRMRAA